MAQGRRTPATTHTVLAVSDVRRTLVNMFLGNDDRLDPHEEHALLLLDTAAYHAGTADLNRRKRDNIEAYGDVTPGLQREINHHEAMFAHLGELKAA